MKLTIWDHFKPIALCRKHFKVLDFQLIQRIFQRISRDDNNTANKHYSRAVGTEASDEGSDVIISTTTLLLFFVLLLGFFVFCFFKGRAENVTAA